MKTYQDLIALGEDEKARKDFILQAINEHKTSNMYITASDAELYYKRQNPTIMRAQKWVYNVLGQRVPDVWVANHKIPSNYYFYFVTQSVQFLLGNGISFNEEKTKKRLGKGFDNVVQKAATNAMNGGVSFGFWNSDHLEQFSVTEFVPLYDEENGALKAGIRFWQVTDKKPLRATLYEMDGLTEYIKPKNDDIIILQEKRPYVQIVAQSAASGTAILDGQNYPGFPIVPLFYINKQSAIEGGREVIDAYDLMASALVNNVDDANIIYWVIKNAGGMDDMDDQKFLERIKTMHVVHTEGDEDVSSHQIDVPFEASETALNRLRSQLFDDFMALDVKQIASGAATATQIKAAYEPLNAKTDLFEYLVTDFIHGIFELIGIDDEPTYTRSLIINQQETIQNLITASEYLSSEYITKKVLEVLGDADNTEEVLSEMLTEDVSRYANEPAETKEQTLEVEQAPQE